MTLLQDFVRNTVGSIIAAKEEQRVVPACATFTEVMAEVREDVRCYLNALAQSGEYDVHYTVNKIPYLVHKPKPTDEP